MKKYLSIYILSIFDLIMTLYFTYKFGNIEWNPIGQFLLNDTFFTITYKVAIIGLLLWFLYLHQNDWLVKKLSTIILMIYILLAVYHFIILVCVSAIMW